MSGSRIWLDLSALFSCLRKKSCIFIDHDKYKTVKDVEEHIRLLFGVETPFHILNDGWLLPSLESSLLLRDNDTISVVSEGYESPPIDNATKNVASEPETTKTSDTNSAAPQNQPLANTAAPQNMPLTNGNLPLTNGNGPSATKENITVSLKTRNPFASSSSSDTIRMVSVKDPVQNNEGTSGKLPTPSEQEDDLDTSEVGTGGRKRKRIRRRKNKSTVTPDPDGEPTPKESRPSRYHTNKLLQGVGHILNAASADQTTRQRNHIFFKEPAAVENCSEVEAPLKAVYNSQSQDPPANSSSGGFSLGNQASTSSFPPINTSVVEGGLSKLMSLGNQKSPAVFERKKPEILRNSEASSDVPKNKALAMKLTPLQTLPVKETIVRFKILKMCNYSPVLSETITARVISPDNTTNQIYVQIKDGLSELQSEKGKFSLEEEDENNDSSPSEYLFLNWVDLIEPTAVEYC